MLSGNSADGRFGPYADPPSTSLTFTNLGFQFKGFGFDFELPGDGTQTTAPGGTDQFSLLVVPSHYFFGGLWTRVGNGFLSFSPFVSGYITPSNAIQTLGNAQYSGIGGLLGDVLIVQGSDIVGAALEGDVSLNINFGSGPGAGLTGAFTNVVAIDDNGKTTAWNDVALTGGPVGGNATVTSAPSTTYALDSGATGYFGGGFYGPNADEIGAIWIITNPDGSAIAEGIFGAGKEFTFTTPPVWMMMLQGDGNPNFPKPTVEMPAAATEGTNPLPDPVATQAGPRLDGSGQLPNGQAFPLTMTSMKYTANGLLADTATNAVGATLTVTESAAQYGTATSYRLIVPNLNIDYTFNKTGPISAPFATGASGAPSYTISTFGLSYTALGRWTVSGTLSEPAQPVAAGTFVFGYETPSGSMPSSGTATYKGTGAVAGIVDIAQPSNKQARVGGDANLTVNFGTGHVGGNFTNMIATTDGTTAQPWNDISVNASIAAGTNNFSGTTAAATAPAGTYTLKGTASGHIDGAFYGPSAQELGAVWSLRNPDGSAGAIGVVGGTKQ